MQSIFKHSSLLFILMGLNFSGSSQVLFDYSDISVFFGDKSKSGYSLQSIEKTKSENLLCVQNKVSFFQVFSKNKSKYTFNLISDYSLPKSKPTTFFGEGEKTNLINYTFLGEQVLGLSYRTTFLDQTPGVFYHTIDPQLGGKSNHGFPIPSFTSLNRNLDLSRISMTTSNDFKYAAITYIPNTKRQDFTNIKYVILKDDYSIRAENEFTYPYPSEKYKPIEYVVFNETEQIFIAGHLVTNKIESNWGSTQTFFEYISITKLNNNKLSFEKLEANGKFFTDIEVTSQQDKILISALYSTFIDGQIEGVYIAVVNKEGKLEKCSFTNFSDEVNRSIKTLKENYFTNPIHAQAVYRMFQILDFKTVSDGYLITSEFNAVEYRYGGTDVPGAANVIDTYYWSSDIIVCKVDMNGKLQWDKVIPKIQRSLNDGGYYLSTSIYCDEEKIHFFFNDNQSNYNDDGNYDRYSDLPFLTQFSNAKNTIAHTSIQLEDGKTQRKRTIGKAETQVIFVPLLSVPFKSNNKLMVYGQNGKKHRVGSISFLK